MASREVRALTRYALDAVDQGLVVFPLQSDSGAPIPGSDWERHATRDPDLVRKWWSIAPFNIGIVTGQRSGIVVLAVRPPHQIGLPHGLDQLRELATAAGAPDPSDTRVVATPTGGFHLYYRLPADYSAPDSSQLPSADGVLAVHVDTLAESGYVVGAGSVVSRRRYRIIKPGEPQPLPTWVITALENSHRSVHPAPESGTTRHRGGQSRPPTVQSSGKRAIPEELAKRLTVHVERIARASPANLRDVLFLAAAQFGGDVAAGRITHASVHEALSTACQRHQESGAITSAVTRATITTGLNRHQLRSRGLTPPAEPRISPLTP